MFAQKPPHWLTTISARFGQWFTVGALVLAALGFYAWWPDVRMAAQVATAVLIIACPCALTLAAPITLGTALGTLGRAGVYLKQGAVALDLSRVDTIAFDKTGTLTTAEATATVDLDGLDERDWARVRRLAAESIHPVSRALAGRTSVEGTVSERARTSWARASAASWTMPPWPWGAHRSWRASRECRSTRRRWPHLGQRRRPRRIAGADHARTRRAWPRSSPRWAPRTRPGCSRATTTPRRRAGGPCSATACASARRPTTSSRMVQARQAAGRHVLMVGDGLNDAGALAAADVGIAVSDDTACLVPACDAVIRGDRLALLPAVLRYARRARAVIVALLRRVGRLQRRSGSGWR